MEEIGFSLEFNKKPITLDNLCATNMFFKLSHLDKESAKEIQSYLDKNECDGALVLNTYAKSEGNAFSYGNLTIAPYVLKPLNQNKA